MQAHAKNLRIGRHSVSSQIYHVTITTLDRKPVFKDLGAARRMIAILMFTHASGWADSICFVVMPDHVHWLFVLGDNKSLQELIRSIKRESTRKIDALQWQRGFYDHAVRREEDIKSIARYIVNNPLRADLVGSVREYSHWDAVWL